MQPGGQRDHPGPEHNARSAERVRGLLRMTTPNRPLAGGAVPKADVIPAHPGHDAGQLLLELARNRVDDDRTTAARTRPRQPHIDHLVDHLVDLLGRRRQPAGLGPVGHPRPATPWARVRRGLVPRERRGLPLGRPAQLLDPRLQLGVGSPQPLDLDPELVALGHHYDSASLQLHHPSGQHRPVIPRIHPSHHNPCHTAKIDNQVKQALTQYAAPSSALVGSFRLLCR